jgi:Tol biopolymer transport system component
VAGTLAFAILSSSAGALETRSVETSFGPDGTSTSEFSDPWSLAFDQGSQILYVASLANRIERFDGGHEPAHERELFSGSSAAIVEGELAAFSLSQIANQLAVSPTTHDLYVVSGSPSVAAYQASGEPANFTAGPAAGTNELGGAEVCGVAVDSAGDIYVSEASTGIQVFTAAGEPIVAIPAYGYCNLAVNAQGDVYASAPHGPVEELEPSIYPVTALTTYSSAGVIDGNASLSVAIDPTDEHLLVDEGSQVAEYSEAGARLGEFGGSPLSGSVGLAVNAATDRVYVSNSEGSLPRQVEVFGPAFVLPDVTTGEASEVRPPGSATLAGVVNADGIEVTDCHFDYGSTTEYGKTAPCEQTVGAGTEAVAVTAKLSGLQPGTTYHFRLQASDANGTNLGQDQTFALPPRPDIKGASASEITKESALLKAEIDPGGLATSYRFEYGPSTEYGTSAPAPEGQLLGSSVAEPVEARIENLSADTTTYHWRVVATNAAGTTVGADHTFRYLTTGEGLPDGRAYEMVTPRAKNGAFVDPVLIVGFHPAIAENGSRVIASSIQCFAGSQSCSAARETEGEQYLFARSPSAWATTALAPPATQFQANSAVLLSPETAMELFSMPTPPANEDDFYIRRADGTFADVGPVSPPAEGPIGEPWGGHTIAATSDFAHIAFQEPGFWAAAESSETVYEFTGVGNAEPKLVGVTGGSGSTSLISRCGTTLGGDAANAEYPGGMSANGETIYFTAKRCEAGTGSNSGTPVPANSLYARLGGARTVKISERSPSACTSLACTGSAARDAAFAGASADGSKAFFTSDQRLTNEASDEANLYEYDFDSAAGENLVDVSAGDPAHGPQVQGVVAISSDGSHVYFVAKGVLAGGTDALGRAPAEGANNLYVFERDAAYPHGRMAFVTQLPEADQQQWATNGFRVLANVTPDGRFLVFESHGDLTPDDSSSTGARQIFRYDAQSGELVRVSTGRDGFDDNGNASLGDASIVQEWIGSASSAGPDRSDPSMSHDGSYVFFESPAGLTPHALDDVAIGELEGRPAYAENVYEWHDGQVSLISDGKDTTTAAQPGGLSSVQLLGSDATGANVFFTTADQLVGGDTDTQLDFYDARICTATEPCIAEPPPPLPPCLDEDCHGIPSGAPAAPTGGSATLNGEGNLSSSHKAHKRLARRKRRPRRCSHSRRHGRKCTGKRPKHSRGRRDGVRKGSRRA